MQTLLTETNNMQYKWFSLVIRLRNGSFVMYVETCLVVTCEQKNI